MALGGLPLTLSDVLAEIQETAPYSLNSAKARWLADAAATGNFNASDFANKLSCKVVATATATPSTTSHTFSGVNFGIAFSDRVLIACTGLTTTGQGVLDQTSCTIGGVSATGGDAGEFLAGGPTCGGGVWAAAVPSGTSGDVTLNWTSSTGQAVALILLSVSGISVTPDDETSDWVGGSGTSSTSASSSIDIPSNGLLVTSMVHAQAVPTDTVMTGVTKREEVYFGTNGVLCVGFDNGMSSETSRAISASWTLNAACGGEGRSYQQS